MKAIIMTLALGASVGLAHASPKSPSAAVDARIATGFVSIVDGGKSIFETKGRSGSRRVGGSGRSGKGGRYVGGR